MGADGHHQNQFPPELERMIFEIAAALDYRSVPHLMRVSRRVREWVEPELYRVIPSVGVGRLVPRFYIRNQQERLKPDLSFLEGFGMHVHHVLLENWTPEEIGQVLERCPNVTNLALWIIRGPCVSLIPIIGSLKSLRRLSFDPSYFFQNDRIPLSIPFDHSMFSHLTHLMLIDVTYPWAKWRKIAVMPALTHLALSGMLVERQLLDLAPRECKRLDLLVVLYSNKYWLDKASKQPPTDPRVVLMLMMMYDSDHWEQGARGKEDFWITAEKVKQDRIESGKSAIAPTSEMTG